MGSLPLAHNAQHSLIIGRAGASPPSRTAAIIFIIYIRVVRRALNLLRASFSPIFQYFSAVNVTRVSFSPIFQYFLTCIVAYAHGIWRHAPWIHQPWKVPSTLIVTFFALNTEMRWRALQTGRVYVKQHPGDAQLSLDELRDMVGREGQTFSSPIVCPGSTKTILTVICCSQKLACTSV